MCNCGNKRQEIVSPQKFKIANSQSIKYPQKEIKNIAFEYTGNTGLTVTGNMTGKRYRYNKNGEVQLIDFRDSAAMEKVPVLKKIV